MKRKPAKSTGAGDHFFAKEVAGQAPLTRNTAAVLVRLAAEFYGYEPWEDLEEDQLIFVPIQEPEHLCACSIMGAIGEFRSLMIYLDSEGYQLFVAAHEQRIGAEEYHSTRKSLHVEFELWRDMKRQDRNLLEALGRKPGAGKLGPSFRASVPGKEPWFINEQEGRILVHCLTALNRYVPEWMDPDDEGPWATKSGLYPAVILNGDPLGGQFYTEVKMMPPPEPPPSTDIELPKFDEMRVQALLNKKLDSAGAMELDVSATVIPIGKPGERREYPLLGLAADAENGMVAGHNLMEYEKGPAANLAETLLMAIETRRAVPREVRVRRPEYRVMLQSLSTVLGFDVRTVKELPAVDEARGALMEFLKRG